METLQGLHLSARRGLGNVASSACIMHCNTIVLYAFDATAARCR
jgi:hypothetical protein